MSAAALRQQRQYQRQYRQRTKAGLCVLRVQVDAVAWPEALISCGMLQPAGD
jgi:hypothetical protein